MKEEIRVIVIGAHPDEPDIYAGGTAALFAELGHRVKFLSLTDGCCGHYSMTRTELVKRRRQEAEDAAKRLGIDEYEVLHTPDGELLPPLRSVTRSFGRLEIGKRMWSLPFILKEEHIPITVTLER